MELNSGNVLPVAKPWENMTIRHAVGIVLQSRVAQWKRERESDPAGDGRKEREDDWSGWSMTRLEVAGG